jgi:hypothetical protein
LKIEGRKIGGLEGWKIGGVEIEGWKVLFDWEELNVGTFRLRSGQGLKVL